MDGIYMQLGGIVRQVSEIIMQLGGIFMSWVKIALPDITIPFMLEGRRGHRIVWVLGKEFHS